MMNNTHFGIVLSTLTVLSVVYGFSWWYAVPFCLSAAFLMYPVHTDFAKKKLELEVRKLELECLKMERGK